MKFNFRNCHLGEYETMLCTADGFMIGSQHFTKELAKIKLDKAVDRKVEEV